MRVCASVRQALPTIGVTAAMQKHRFGFATTGYWRNLIGDPSQNIAANPTYQSVLDTYSGACLFNKYNNSEYK